jgi:hypothetical protein
MSIGTFIDSVLKHSAKQNINLRTVRLLDGSNGDYPAVELEWRTGKGRAGERVSEYDLESMERSGMKDAEERLAEEVAYRARRNIEQDALAQRTDPDARADRHIEMVFGLSKSFVSIRVIRGQNS